MRAISAHFDFFVHESFVRFVISSEFERVRDVSFALCHACDHVGAADPVGFSEVGLGPLCRMVGMGVVEADNIFVACAAFPLDADELLRIDVVAILRGVGARVAAAGSGGDGAYVAVHLAEKNTTAFMRVGFLAVAANFSVILASNSKHREIFHHGDTESQSHRGNLKQTSGYLSSRLCGFEVNSGPKFLEARRCGRLTTGSHLFPEALAEIFVAGVAQDADDHGGLTLFAILGNSQAANHGSGGGDTDE